MLVGLHGISPIWPPHLLSKKKKKCANVLHIDLIDTKFVDAKSFSDLLIFKEYAVLERLW